MNMPEPGENMTLRRISRIIKGMPANHKMDKAAYQEYSAEHIPLESREGGIEVRVITGVTSKGTKGPVVQPLTDPLYLDVRDVMFW